MNEPSLQEGFASGIKTCFLALVLSISPMLSLATIALDDVVFPNVEAPAGEVPCLLLP